MPLSHNLLILQLLKLLILLLSIFWSNATTTMGNNLYNGGRQLNALTSLRSSCIDCVLHSQGFYSFIPPVTGRSRCGWGTWIDGEADRALHSCLLWARVSRSCTGRPVQSLMFVRQFILSSHRALKDKSHEDTRQAYLPCRGYWYQFSDHASYKIFGLMSSVRNPEQPFQELFKRLDFPPHWQESSCVIFCEDFAFCISLWPPSGSL